MHRQWHHAWALADSAAVCVNDSAASTKSAAGADDNLDSGRSKACEAVTLAACVLAVGSWLVRTYQCSCSSFGSSYRQFAAVSYMGKKLAEHGIMGAPAVQEVRGSLYL